MLAIALEQDGLCPARHAWRALPANGWQPCGAWHAMPGMRCKKKRAAWHVLPGLCCVASNNSHVQWGH
eukprot:3101056-Lingulodinium_polyedra.AAC.1